MDVIRTIKYTAVSLSLILLMSAGLLAREVPVQQADAREIIDGVIKAYGGAEGIERVRAVYAKGKIKAVMRGDEGTYARYFERDRKLRVETIYSRSSEIRILNGRKGWRSENNQPLPEVTDSRYLAMVYQYKQLDLPYGLLKKKYLLKSALKESSNSGEFFVLQLYDGEGPPLKVYIDPGNFYIVKVTGYFGTGEHMMALSAEFSDFRPIDGMPFPYRIANYAGGRKVGETNIEEYSINSPMDSSLFKP